MKKYTAFVVVMSGVILASCTAEQQAFVAVPGVVQVVTDPNVSVQDKACRVLEWGLPIAQSRVNLTGKQAIIANGAAQVASAYCFGKNLSWRDRANAAADELSLVLWDVIR